MSEPSSSANPALSVVTATLCRHLRSNGMSIFTDVSRDDPGDDEFNNSIYMCLRTMKGFGPDDELVNRPDCRNAGRTCYEPT